MANLVMAIIDELKNHDVELIENFNERMYELSCELGRLILFFGNSNLKHEYYKIPLNLSFIQIINIISPIFSNYYSNKINSCEFVNSIELNDYIFIENNPSDRIRIILLTKKSSEFENFKDVIIFDSNTQNIPSIIANKFAKHQYGFFYYKL